MPFKQTVEIASLGHFLSEHFQDLHKRFQVASLQVQKPERLGRIQFHEFSSRSKASAETSNSLAE